jgi:hypothetical protein
MIQFLNQSNFIGAIMIKIIFYQEVLHTLAEFLRLKLRQYLEMTTIKKI